MVSETAPLPNVKRMFIPDEGYTIIDADLAKADAQIVAWEAGDEVLKQMFREGVNLHAVNAQQIFNLKKPADPSSFHYKNTRSGVHAVNYGVRAKRLSEVLGSTIKEAQDFINRWFDIHPAIKLWQARVHQEVLTTRTIYNPFGFRKYFFDSLKGILPKALAWVPQSAVAIVTNHGLINLAANRPETQLLGQVHDSLVFQTPTDLTPEIYPKILKELLIPIPYEDPLTIPVGMATSTKSWGDVEKITVGQT